MAKAKAVIQSIKYDLNETEAKVWGDTELLELLNRAVFALDSRLSTLNSDWVETSDSLTLASGASTATAPTRCMSAQKVWNSTTCLTKASSQYVRNQLQLNGTGTGSPTCWAHGGVDIIFNRLADAEYTLTIFYRTYSAALTKTTDMPYDDQFNQELRQASTFIAKSRNSSVIDGKVSGHLTNADADLIDWFNRSSLARIVARKSAYQKRGDF